MLLCPFGYFKDVSTSARQRSRSLKFRSKKDLGISLLKLMFENALSKLVLECKDSS